MPPIRNLTQMIKELHIGDHLIKLAIPADVEAVLAIGDDPYWAELWSSSLALSEYLAREFDCRGRHLLEIGCGMGLVGLIAAKQGADVLLTDYNQDALEFARFNLHQNGCSHAQVRYLDWHAPDLEDLFDNILASDVIYDTANWDALLVLWERLLKQGGEILLAEPGRPDAPLFLERAAHRGFIWTDRFQSIHHEGKWYQISIYRMCHQG